MRPSARPLCLAAILATCLATGLVLPLAPLSAQAPGDRQYCARLAKMYIYYLGHDETSAYDDVKRGMNDAQVATTRCDIDTAGSIAVLEKRLRDAKLSLPPRG